jgi:hypothetical protein
MAYNALIQKVDSNVVEVQDPFLFRMYYSVVYAKQNNVGYHKIRISIRSRFQS